MYNVTHPVVEEQFSTTDLVGFSKMEAKCAESLEALKVDDKVLVVYVTGVAEDKESVPPIRIALTEPIIVKQEYFEQFAQRLLDSFAAQKASGSTPPIEVKTQ